MATAPKLKPGQGGFTFDATVFLGNLEAAGAAEVRPSHRARPSRHREVWHRQGVEPDRQAHRAQKCRGQVAGLSYDSVRVGDYQVTIRSSRKPIPLYDFPGTAQTASGVRTRAWGRSQVLGSAFVATMRTGHRGAFRRRGRTRTANPGIVGTNNLWHVSHVGSPRPDPDNSSGSSAGLTPPTARGSSTPRAINEKAGSHCYCDPAPVPLQHPVRAHKRGEFNRLIAVCQGSARVIMPYVELFP